MRRITLAIAGTIAALVLLFSYRTSTSGSTTGAAAAPPGVVRNTTHTSGGSASGSASASGSNGSGDTVVNGSAVNDGYGTVQVRVRISGNRITDVSTVSLPGDSHSQQINSYAVPRLRQEVLAAQGSHVDTVSGATLTSDAYRTSVQAALDAAHFGG